MTEKEVAVGAVSVAANEIQFQMTQYCPAY